MQIVSNCPSKNLTFGYTSRRASPTENKLIGVKSPSREKIHLFHLQESRRLHRKSIQPSRSWLRDKWKAPPEKVRVNYKIYAVGVNPQQIQKNESVLSTQSQKQKILRQTTTAIFYCTKSVKPKHSAFSWSSCC